MQQISGIGVVATQISQIVALFNPELAPYVPVIITFLQNLATFGAFFALSKFGRRPILLFGNFSLGFFDLMLGILFYFSEWGPAITIVLIILTVYMMIFGFTTGPLVWAYVPEIITPDVVPYATCLNWIGCSFGIVVTPILTHLVGSPYPVFFIFGSCSLILFIFNAMWLVETKGLTPTEIKLKFNEKNE